MKKHIIAMGGGGFSHNPKNSPLDDYVFGLTGKESPKICFLPTASGDSEKFILKFTSAFAKRPCDPSVLTLEKARTLNVEEYLMNQDIIFVGGGYMEPLLTGWRETGIDKALKLAWEQGVVLWGSSAGANCWFETSMTDGKKNKVNVLHDGLGFLTGGVCPHYHGEVKWEQGFRAAIQNEEIISGFGIDDYVALHFVGNELAHALTDRTEAKAIWLVKRNGEVEEHQLAMEYLNKEVNTPTIS